MAYDSVPIFNILTKLFHLVIRGKSFSFFLFILYFSSKTLSRFLDMISEEFDIHHGVRQVCPLSLFFFFNNFFMINIKYNILLKIFVLINYLYQINKIK